MAILAVRNAPRGWGRIFGFHPVIVANAKRHAGSPVFRGELGEASK